MLFLYSVSELCIYFLSHPFCSLNKIVQFLSYLLLLVNMHVNNRWTKCLRWRKCWARKSWWGHRIRRRDLSRPRSQTACHEEGHLQLDYIAQTPIQPGLECCQRWGIYCISGKPVSGFNHPHKKIFRVSSLSLSLYHLKLYPFSYHYRPY